MFDLELEIQQWKQSFRALDSVATNDVEELESHLRDLISQLCRMDLTEQEALMVATRRLGNTEELDHEFSKVHGMAIWRKRILWMLCGYGAYIAISIGIQAITTIAVTGMLLSGSGVEVASVTLIAILAFAWSAVIGLVYRQTKSTDAGPDRLPATWIVLALATIILGTLLGQGATILLARHIDASEFGHIALWRVYGSFAVHSCLLIASAFFIWKLGEPKGSNLKATT